MNMIPNSLCMAYMLEMQSACSQEVQQKPKCLLSIGGRELLQAFSSHKMVCWAAVEAGGEKVPCGRRESGEAVFSDPNVKAWTAWSSSSAAFDVITLYVSKSSLETRIWWSAWVFYLSGKSCRQKEWWTKPKSTCFPFKMPNATWKGV